MNFSPLKDFSVLNISYTNSRITKLCTNLEALFKEFKDIKLTKKIKDGLVILESAPSLQDIRALPQLHLHTIQLPKKIVWWAIDVNGRKDPNRIVFSICHEPLPMNTAAEIDFSQITDIEIEFIGNYH
jgi:plasmid maintenance system killer protein